MDKSFQEFWPDFFLLLKLDKDKVMLYTQDENINVDKNKVI